MRRPGQRLRDTGLHHLRGLALDAEGRNAEALAARTAAATIASERGGSPPGSVPPVSRTADHPVGRAEWPVRALLDIGFPGPRGGAGRGSGGTEGAGHRGPASLPGMRRLRP